MGKIRQEPKGKKRRKIDASKTITVSGGAEKLSKVSVSEIALLAGLTVFVCVATFVTHWPALSAQAQSFDDAEYLTESFLLKNPGWASAKQVFIEVLQPSAVRGSYIPLTMISMMVDRSMGGSPANLRPFHRTSLVLHIANTALVIVFLYLLFGNAWAAAAAGLLFGLHPLSVGRIAWASDRKTVLTAFFALWCLVFYVRYTKKSGWKYYVMALIMYMLALMSKPTSLPIPLLLLLLDYWPLKRLNRRAILEKLPFAGIGAVSLVISFLSFGRTATMTTPAEYGMHQVPLVLCHNIVFYLHKILWPTNLSPYYPVPEPFSLLHPVILAGVIGTCILIIVLFASLHWTRALLTGWLFFLTAIFTTFGIIGFTPVIAANRFAYFPMLGILMVPACFLARCFKGRAIIRFSWSLVFAAIVLFLAGLEAAACRRYLTHWRDTKSLFEYALTTAPDSAVVHRAIGDVYEAQGKFDKAIYHYKQAVQIEPDCADAYNNLGFLLRNQGKLKEAADCFRQSLQYQPKDADVYNNLGVTFASMGRFDEAFKYYQKALEINPNHAKTHNNLGLLLMSRSNFDEAIGHYRQALKSRPDYAEAFFNMGIAFSSSGRPDRAERCYRDAIRLKPDYIEAHNNLGNILLNQGRFDESIYHYRQALRINPDYSSSLNGLADVLATQPDNYEEAVELAERAAELTGHRNPIILSTLAKAYAAAGQTEQAIKTAQKVLELASASQNEALVKHISEQLKLYTHPQPED